MATRKKSRRKGSSRKRVPGKKTTKRGNRIPLSILKERHAKLGRIIRQRGG